MKNLPLVKICFPLILSAVLSACGGSALDSSSSSSSAAAVVPSSSSSATTSQSSSTAVSDTQAPTMPASLMLGSVTTSSVTLNWSQSTDNVAVTGYQVYRDNVSLSTVSSSTEMIVDSTVSANKTYVYGIKARDAAGNWSSLKTITAVTPSAVGVGGSSSSSSKASSTASTTSSSKASSTTSVAASSKASSSSSSAQSLRSVALGWAAPTQRENGDPLSSSEIGGYSIRYTSQTTGAVSTQNVIGGTSTSATVNSLTGTYTFEIATYDTAGLYSDYALIGVK